MRFAYREPLLPHHARQRRDGERTFLVSPVDNAQRSGTNLGSRGAERAEVGENRSRSGVLRSSEADVR